MGPVRTRWRAAQHALRSTRGTRFSRWTIRSPDGHLAVQNARVLVPSDPLTIVPLAIALATVMQSAEAAILLATNIGGDSDSVASIAGSILGARFPETVNEKWYTVVENVNDHHLIALGEDLAELRH
jgi:hypothetical protein